MKKTFVALALCIYISLSQSESIHFIEPIEPHANDFIIGYLTEKSVLVHK